jgi:hypothetical protein
MRGSSPLSNVDEIIDIFDTAYEQNNGLFERDYYYFINNPLTYYELQELYSKNEQLYHDYIDIMFYGHPIELISTLVELGSYGVIEYITTLVDLLTTYDGYPHRFTKMNSEDPLVFKYKATFRLDTSNHPGVGVGHIIRCEEDSFVVEVDKFSSIYMRVLEGAI